MRGSTESRDRAGHGYTRKLAVVTTHIAPSRGFGGIAEAAARLARGWGDRSVPVLLCSSDASLGRPLVAGDVVMPPSVTVRLYRTQAGPRWGLGLGAIPAIAATCWEADVVYIAGVGTWPTTLAALYCRLTGKPYVVGLHAGLMAGHVAYIRTHKPVKRLFYTVLTVPSLRRAMALHATSQVEADGARAVLPDARIAIVPNPIDPDTWSVAPPREGDGALVLGYVGRLSPEKGILPFLRVWLEWRRPGDRLLIAGAGEGEYGAAVERLVTDAGGGIDLLGYVGEAEVRAMMARCDAVVLPSGMGDVGLRENFGNTVIEAMAIGRPVLVTRGMAWDELDELGAGIVFTPDAAGVRDGLDRLARRTPADRAAMGRTARRVVEERYALPVVAAALLDVLIG